LAPLDPPPIGEDLTPKSDMVTGIPKHDGKGFLLILDTPGIGVELKPDELGKCPMKSREVVRACTLMRLWRASKGHNNVYRTVVMVPRKSSPPGNPLTKRFQPSVLP
jgi:hypothetical protein